MSKLILMEGYYGRGNFGDDVLMHVTYQLLRKTHPDAHIAIVITDPSQRYIAKLLDGVALEAPDRRAHYDLTVHGGGGVFFDFTAYGSGYRVRENLIRLLGFPAFLKGAAFMRSVTGKRLPTSDKRIGLGIGIGSFSPGSPRMLKALPILADFDALWLRDTQSQQQLARFGSVLRADIIEGSDLAFLSEYWAPAPIPRAPAAKPKLGVALRDWPGTDIHAVRNNLTKLAKHYDITGFIFDTKSDTLTRHVLGDLPIHSWTPESMHIADFAAQLAAQDVLLTSRAHGAICGACLGVPSVIVNIEPKMGQINAMLPNATRLVDHDGWKEVLEQARHIAPGTITADVGKNRTASAQALTQMQRWLA